MFHFHSFNMDQLMNFLSDEDKQLLNERYLDLSFVDKLPSEFRCALCGRVAFVNFVSNCGHIFCHKCKTFFDFEDDANARWDCQTCSFEIKEFVQSEEIETEMFELKVYCPNKTHGCQQILKLKEIPNHIKICKFTSQAKLRDEQSETLKIWKVIEEMRMSNQLVLNAQKDLDKTIASHENKLQHLIDKSKTTAEQTVKNAATGALSNLKLQEMQIVQNRLINDLQLLQNNFNSILAKTDQMMAKIDKLAVENYQPEDSDDDQPLVSTERNVLPSDVDRFHQRYCDRPTAYTWILSNIDKEFEKKTQLSPVFVVFGHKIDAQAKIRFNTDQIDVSLCFTNVDKTDGPINFDPPYPRVTYRLLDVGDNETVQDVIRAVDGDFGEILLNKTFSYEVVLWNGDTLLQRYLNNDQLTIEVTIDYPFTTDDPASMNGILMWKVDNYQEIRRSQHRMTDVHYSPYFHTSENGYRAKASLAITKGIIVYVQFVSGEFDHFLKHSQLFEATTTLIDQSGCNDDIVVTKRQMGFNPIKCRLISSQSLHKIQNYLKRNTILIKIELIPQ